MCDSFCENKLRLPGTALYSLCINIRGLTVSRDFDILVDESDEEGEQVPLVDPRKYPEDFDALLSWHLFINVIIFFVDYAFNEEQFDTSSSDSEYDSDSDNSQKYCDGLVSVSSNERYLIIKCSNMYTVSRFTFYFYTTTSYFCELKCTFCFAF